MSLTDDDIRAAMALPGFRWMPGMLTPLGRLLQRRGRPLPEGPASLYLPGGGSPGHALLIDPTDPATAGCLLALSGFVRVWQDASDGLWTVDVGPVHSSMWHTLGEACVRVALALGRWGAP